MIERRVFAPASNQPCHREAGPRVRGMASTEEAAPHGISVAYP
ncbi:MAG TPA: hypothetical protein VM536_23515 [Chloroflexia bacterium]|nr:hypothetical protein [Chloroflexia bacterium]